jgi:hypothetical protein
MLFWERSAAAFEVRHESHACGACTIVTDAVVEDDQLACAAHALFAGWKSKRRDGRVH